MYYICTQSGHIIDSRKSKIDADNFVVGTAYFVRPSPEAIQLEKARQEFNRINAQEAHA